MSFNRPTLKELIEQSKNEFQNRLSGYADSVRFSLSKIFAYVIAGATHLLYGYLDWISKQALPDTADDEILIRWGIILGVNRKNATYAERDIELSGTVGSTIPDETYIVNPITGIEYKTTSEATIGSTGVITVHIESLTSGSSSNVDSGDTLKLVSPISGINNEVTVKSTNLVEAEDIEDIDDYRLRIVSRLQNPPLGGAEADYETWALEVSGVTRAWVYPNHLGLGTVGVSFVQDDETDIIPSDAKVTEVQNYIDELRPVTADLTVFAPIKNIVNLTIEIKPNTTTIQNNVKAELEDLFKRKSEPGGIIYLSEISEAISVASGETAHHLISPTSDIQATTGRISTLGAITWQTMS
jgi:uncharacterized phage protein gp47/JayE